MKKNIKYTGIAAATLLMVAPLAAPVFSTASTAQADAATSTTDSSTLDDATQASLTRALSTIPSTVTPTSTPSFSDVLDAYNTHTLDNTATAGIGLFGLTSISGALTSTPLSPDTQVLDDKKITYGVQGVRDGSVLTSKSDFDLYIKDAATSAITLRITAYSGDTAVATKDITFQPVKQATKISSVALKYTDPYTVVLGSSTTDPQYSSTVDAAATDQDGNSIKISSVAPGAIYSSKSAAYAASAGTAITDPTFKTDGATYYQPITVTLDPSADLNTIYQNVEFGQGGSITLNGASAIDRNVNIDGYIKPGDGDPAVAQTLTYVRAIKVSSTVSSNWTVTPIKGVVTVGGSIAALCDDNGQPSTGRSLAAGTPWLTDEKRVNNSTGAVQYRVSTHEWVAAEDVSYSDGTTPAGGLTDITDLQGRHVVNLDGPSGFVYSLYDSTGKLASRGLAGATSWLTDKTATGSDGSTYYRVSTDEWIKAGNGVNFK